MAHNKKDEIIRELRRRITGGRYRPGDRLPTRTELFAEFGVSSKTLQCALDELIGEGYVVPRGKLGSFVADSPPHLTRICLLFREDFDEICAFNQQFRSIRSELENVSHRLGVHFELISNVQMFSQADRLIRLVEDVHARNLAGIFLLGGSWILENSPILNDSAVIRVALSNTPLAYAPSLYPDYPDFHRQAIRVLRERNCRRPALLLDMLSAGCCAAEVRALYEAVGWPLRAEDWLSLPTGSPLLLENLIELIFRRDSAERPDSLVLCDDNALETVSSKLRELKVGNDFTLICMANFPYLTPSALPVIRIGFDTSAILETATRMILRQLNGEKVSELVLLPARPETAYARPLKLIQPQLKEAIG